MVNQRNEDCKIIFVVTKIRNAGEFRHFLFVINLILLKCKLHFVLISEEEAPTNASNSPGSATH